MHAITVTLPDSLRLWFDSLSLSFSISCSPFRLWSCLFQTSDTRFLCVVHLYTYTIFVKCILSLSIIVTCTQMSLHAECILPLRTILINPLIYSSRFSSFALHYKRTHARLIASSNIVVRLVRLTLFILSIYFPTYVGCTRWRCSSRERLLFVIRYIIHVIKTNPLLFSFSLFFLSNSQYAVRCEFFNSLFSF